MAWSALVYFFYKAGHATVSKSWPIPKQSLSNMYIGECKGNSAVNN